MRLARLLVSPGSVPNSCMEAPGVHRKARVPAVVSATPTTAPALLMLCASLHEPPSVPRSVTVFPLQTTAWPPEAPAIWPLRLMPYAVLELVPESSGSCVKLFPLLQVNACIPWWELDVPTTCPASLMAEATL